MWQAKRFKKRIVATILYVFYFSWFLCYASIVPGKQTNPKRKEASIVKKLEKLFEEFEPLPLNRKTSSIKMKRSVCHEENF